MTENLENLSKPYAVEVIADSSGKWCGNALRYATYNEAREAAINLAYRWTAVREWRVINAETNAVQYS